jgi:hypothetical protein
MKLLLQSLIVCAVFTPTTRNDSNNPLIPSPNPFPYNQLLFSSSLRSLINIDEVPLHSRFGNSYKNYSNIIAYIHIILTSVIITMSAHSRLPTFSFYTDIPVQVNSQQRTKIMVDGMGCAKPV